MTRTLIGSARTLMPVSRGNLVYNGDFEIAPGVLTAQTNTVSKWVDGTATGSSAKSGLGWGTTAGALTSSAAAGFDNTVSHSGTYSMKLSTLNATGVIVIGNLRDAAAAGTLYQAFPISPSASYTLTGWIKTNNVATNSAFIDFRQLSAAAATLVTTSSTKFTGTNNWTRVTFTVTTNASAAFGVIFMRNNVAGNTGDAWFDDITLVKNVLGRSVAGSRTLA